MLEQISVELSLRQILVSVAILLIFIGLAWLCHAFLSKAAGRLARRTRTRLDDVVLSALQRPLIAVITLVGLYVSIISLPLETVMRSYVSKGLAIAMSLLGIYAVMALIDAMARWYERDIVGNRVSGLTKRLLWLFRVGTMVVGVVVAIVVVLEIFDIGVAPLTGWLGTHGWRIVFIIAVSMGAILAVARFIPRLVESAVAKRKGEAEEEISKRTDTLSRVLVNVGQIVVLFVAAFTVLSELEINIAPILAGVGVAGIAIGFGAQSLVKDLLAGLFIIVESQYHVGDVVRIADIAGLVEDINLRRTVLRDLDGIVHFVPNGEIRVASNFTKEWSRVNLNVTVAYGENLDHAISVINRVGKELAEDPQWAPLILKPPQVLRVDNLGESGVDIKILGDTKPIRQWDVMGELRKRLKKAFDEEGIEIPWPHTKVYFGNSPPQPEGGEGLAGKPHD